MDAPRPTGFSALTLSQAGNRPLRTKRYQIAEPLVPTVGFSHSHTYCHTYSNGEGGEAEGEGSPVSPPLVSPTATRHPLRKSAPE